MKVESFDRVEDIVAKVEIAHNEQFLLLSQCIQKSFAAEVSESVSVGKGYEEQDKCRSD